MIVKILNFDFVKAFDYRADYHVLLTPHFEENNTLSFIPLMAKFKYLVPLFPWARPNICFTRHMGNYFNYPILLNTCLAQF